MILTRTYATPDCERSVRTERAPQFHRHARETTAAVDVSPETLRAGGRADEREQYATERHDRTTRSDGDRGYRESGIP